MYVYKLKTLTHVSNIYKKKNNIIQIKHKACIKNFKHHNLKYFTNVRFFIVLHTTGTSPFTCSSGLLKIVFFGNYNKCNYPIH